MTRDETLKAAGDAGIVAIHAFGALNWNDEVDALLATKPCSYLNDGVPESDQGH